MQTHRKPRNVDSQNTQKPEEYEFSRKNYLQSTQFLKERPGRKYIYVIFHHGKGSYPFYVGQTNDLATRFSRHDEITWHYAKFQRKAIVHVIASVPEEFATKVEKKAIEVLSKTGFILNNSSMNKDQAKRLRDMSWPEIQIYQKLTQTITAYEALPKIQAYARRIENQAASSKAQEEAQTGMMTSAKLYRIVTKRVYGSNQSRSLAYALAQEYDSVTQTSSHIFPRNPNIQEDQQVKLIRSAIKGLRGDWIVRDEIINLDQPTIFLISPNLETAVPKKITYGRSIKIPATQKELKQHKLDLLDSLVFSVPENKTFDSKGLVNPPHEDLRKIIISRQYKSNAAVFTAQKLSKTYDESTGIATFRFKGSNNPKKYARLFQEAREAIHLITGDWSLIDPLELQKELHFKLTDTVKLFYMHKMESSSSSGEL